MVDTQPFYPLSSLLKPLSLIYTLPNCRLPQYHTLLQPKQKATEDLRKEMGRQHRTGTKNALASTRSKSGSKDSRNPAFDDGPALEASLAALYDALFPSTA